MAAMAAEMHRDNVLVYPHKLSFAPLTKEIRGEIARLGDALADSATERTTYHPFVYWGWDDRLDTGEFDESAADLAYMRDRLGLVTPLLTPGLPWIFTYVSAPRPLSGGPHFLTMARRVRVPRAVELLEGRTLPPMVANAAIIEAVQDCVRVARGRMERRSEASEPWSLTAWKRRF